MTPKTARSASESKALLNLAGARTLQVALKAVEELEKEHGYQWAPVGGYEANFGLISIGSDPGDALVERVTNAIDAVIEREALRNTNSRKKQKDDPATPREAVEVWFDVPGGRIGNIEEMRTRQQLAEEVTIELLDGGSKTRPQIMIRDLGIGLTGKQIPKTILSLGASNKIDKMYLAGAYGQGGSTTLAFSPEGTLFLSRRQVDLLPEGEEDQVSVTFARFEELDPETNKNGRYAYLVDRDGNVSGAPAARLADFKPGTLVLHFHYQFEGYSHQLTQQTGSVWWLLHNVLFDPVLPIWAADSRSWVTSKNHGKPQRRSISGNNARLSRDDNENVEYQGSLDVHLDHIGGQTQVRVNYWVVKPRGDGDTKASTDTYVDPYKPVTFTFNGQRHGTEDRRFIANRLQLSYLAKFLVIQVELDNLHAKARRDVLSSTRDRLKQSAFLEQIRGGVASAMQEDEELFRLNESRKEDLLAHHSQKDRDRMKQRFADLMKRLPSGTDAKSQSKGSEEGGRPKPGPWSREPLQPLPTQKRPTFIKIANTKLPIPVQIGRHALIRLESDAPDGYLDKHTHARITIAPQPDKALVLESKSDFRGGRSRLTIKAAEGTKVGTDGTLTVFLLTPEGQSLMASAKFRVEQTKSRDTAGDNRKSEVKTPEPVPVHRAQWGEHQWDENSVAKVHPGAEPKIFVNVDNVHLDALLTGGGYQETGLSRMKDNFVLYVAFYAWNREANLIKDPPKDLSGEEFERYQAAELDRLAQTVVYSISSAARIAPEDS